MADNGMDRGRTERLPLGRNEDVEFNRELADEDDLEALQRAAEADRRAEAAEMDGRLVTARFDRLDQAESAATKLRSIRARDVEISPWNAGGHGNDGGELSKGFGLPGIGLPGTSALAFPQLGAAVFPASGYADPTMHEDDGGLADTRTQGYLLCAVLNDAERDKAVRILREADGRIYE